MHLAKKLPWQQYKLEIDCRGGKLCWKVPRSLSMQWADCGASVCPASKGPKASWAQLTKTQPADWEIAFYLKLIRQHLRYCNQFRDTQDKKDVDKLVWLPRCLGTAKLVLWGLKELGLFSLEKRRLRREDLMLFTQYLWEWPQEDRAKIFAAVHDRRTRKKRHNS